MDFINFQFKKKLHVKKFLLIGNRELNGIQEIVGINYKLCKIPFKSYLCKLKYHLNLYVDFL
jgi:hypothetical protein